MKALVVVMRSRVIAPQEEIDGLQSKKVVDNILL